MLDHHPAIRMADQGPVLFNSKSSHRFIWRFLLWARLLAAPNFVKCCSARYLASNVDIDAAHLFGSYLIAWLFVSKMRALRHATGLFP
jgi:hypothetical protein